MQTSTAKLPGSRKTSAQTETVRIVDVRPSEIILWIIRCAIIIPGIGALLMSTGVWDVAVNTAASAGSVIRGDSADSALAGIIIILNIIGFGLTFTIKGKPIDDD